MEREANVHAKAPVTHLVSGIFDDAQELARQQLTLLRLEVEERLSAAKSATILMACGGLLVLLGVALLSFMLVYVLVALYPSLPLWACFGVVGAPIALTGGVVAWLGSRSIRSVGAPFVETKRAMQENVEWITAQRKSVNA
ncbi:MAG: phage holin family protein [Candidatus Hydrogenedentes bacterium]|nr:phage holin family protein [Candidatus Hydrogenedentota bacterium]